MCASTSTTASGALPAQKSASERPIVTVGIIMLMSLSSLIVSLPRFRAAMYNASGMPNTSESRVATPARVNETKMASIVAAEKKLKSVNLKK
ncbi:Uncharacterised protein [uncultured archaeon]|nr:Uncharacterised protein [uncultured archaeon]